jgi:hypothetical protein
VNFSFLGWNTSPLVSAILLPTFDTSSLRQARNSSRGSIVSSTIPRRRGAGRVSLSELIARARQRDPEAAVALADLVEAHFLQSIDSLRRRRGGDPKAENRSLRAENRSLRNEAVRSSWRSAQRRSEPGTAGPRDRQQGRSRGGVVLAQPLSPSQTRPSGNTTSTPKVTSTVEAGPHDEPRRTAIEPPRPDRIRPEVLRIGNQPRRRDRLFDLM